MTPLQSYPDKTRGIFNEGGLFGERAGWHLPGFDTSSWSRRPLSEGLPDNAAGVGFFVTTFDLQIPEGTDVPISFVFNDHSERYRASLFVNGWKYGKVSTASELSEICYSPSMISELVI